MEAFVGKYQRHYEEHFEDILVALEVPVILRLVAMQGPHVTGIWEEEEEEGLWTISSETPFLVMESKFTLGQEFEQTTPDGREVRATVTFEDGVLVMWERAKKKTQKSTKSTWKMNGPNELIYTITIEGNDDLVCLQLMKRLE